VKGEWSTKFEIRGGARWLLVKRTRTWTGTVDVRGDGGPLRTAAPGDTAPTLPRAYASGRDFLALLGALALGGALYLAARWLFAIPQPYALLSRWRLALAVALVGVLLLAFSAGLNVGVVKRWSPRLAFNNLLVSCGLVWLLGYHVVAWADVTRDHGPSRVTGAGARDEVHLPKAKSSSPRGPFIGIRVASVDEEIGDTFLPAGSLETWGGTSGPAPYTHVAMTLHQGWLGIRWVDHVNWDDALRGIR